MLVLDGVETAHVNSESGRNTFQMNPFTRLSQPLGIEWFYEEVVGPESHGLDCVVYCAVCGYDHNQHSREEFPDALEQTEPPCAGHLDVHEQDIVEVQFHEAQGLFARFCLVHRSTFFFEPCGQRLSYDKFIIYHHESEFMSHNSAGASVSG